MRPSVEHHGPQHEYQDFVIGDCLVMRICLEYEVRRVAFMAPLLTRYSRLFHKQPYPEQAPKSFEAGRCYENAATLSKEMGLIYCEGILLSVDHRGRILKMPHAWCCGPRGMVIDPTCHKAQNADGIQYIGIPFRTQYVREWYDKWGFHGILDGHPEHGDTVGPYVDHPGLWLATV